MVQQTNKQTIAVLIPCYNESKTIEKVVKDFAKALPSANIYVFDNNSTDGTDTIAQNAGAIVKYEYRQGKGNVIRSMFRTIEADCYIMVDGDDTYPAENAKEMCNLIINHGIDMVIGDRLSTSYFQENKRAFHNFGNRIVRSLINILFRSNLKDIMSGYRAFSRSYVKNIPIISKGFEIETEMTIHALDKNFLIKEIPISYRDRTEGSISKLNTYQDGVKVLLTIFRLFRDYKPYLFFTLWALFFEVIAIVFTLPVISEYIQTGLVPRFPTLIAAVSIAIIGLLFYFCGIILDVIQNKNKQLFELLMNKGT